MHIVKRKAILIYFIHYLYVISNSIQTGVTFLALGYLEALKNIYRTLMALQDKISFLDDYDTIIWQNDNYIFTVFTKIIY